MDSTSLIDQIVPPLDKPLAEALIAEFLNVERRFVLGDWEPTTLDGGQFAEIAARIVYHIDSKNLNRNRKLDDCLKYVEDEKNANSHPARATFIHVTAAQRSQLSRQPSPTWRAARPPSPL